MSKSLILVLLSGFLGLGKSFSYMAEEDGNSVCEICDCDFGRIPYFIDCSGKKLKAILTNWDIDYPEDVEKSEILIDVGQCEKNSTLHRTHYFNTLLF